MKVIDWGHTGSEDDDLYHLGKYFKGVNSCCDYAIVIREYDNDRCIVDVWDIGSNNTGVSLSNGDMIKMFKPENVLTYTVELWGKYYFIKTCEDQPQQMYYQDEEDNSIHDVIAELHKEAILYGLEASDLELY